MNADDTKRDTSPLFHLTRFRIVAASLTLVIAIISAAVALRPVLPAGVREMSPVMAARVTAIRTAMQLYMGETNSGLPPSLDDLVFTGRLDKRVLDSIGEDKDSILVYYFPPKANPVIGTSSVVLSYVVHRDGYRGKVVLKEDLTTVGPTWIRD